MSCQCKQADISFETVDKQSMSDVGKRCASAFVTTFQITQEYE